MSRKNQTALHLQNFNSLPEMFFSLLPERREKTLLKIFQGGAWKNISWGAMAQQVQTLAGALKAKKVKRQEPVALFCENGHLFVMADLAIQSVGGVTVSIHATASAAQVKELLVDSGAKVLLVSGGQQLAKAREVLLGLSSKLTVLRLEKSTVADFDGPEVWKSLGEGFDEAALNASISKIKREDLATLIYTSGSTGKPKGVMLSHGNILSNLEGLAPLMPLGPKDVLLSTLPLSHAFERTCGLYLPILMGSVVAYSRSTDLILEDAAQVKPTLMISIPRFFEKVFKAFEKETMNLKPVQRALLKIGTNLAQEGVIGGGKADPVAAISSQLFFKELQEKMGGNIRYFISGGAALGSSLSLFFKGAGMPILEGYGMTECGPVLTCHRPGDIQHGTVGRPIAGVEIKIAEDGEILAKGPSITRGYFKDPEESAELLKNGWLHTGDIGTWRDGHLVLTGRKKELIITSSGKNIPPVRLEALLLASPLVEQAMVVGDDRPYLGALIVPNKTLLNQMAEEESWEFGPGDDLLESPEVMGKFHQLMDSINQDLPGYEKIRKFVLLENEFSLQHGELTPTGKLKRKTIESHRYAAVMGLYE